jgi:hypothetical protein
MHPRRAARLSLAALLLLAAGCERTPAWIAELENGDFSKVRFERAPGGMQSVVPDGELERQVAQVREYFDGNPSLLNTIAGQCPCIEASPLEPFQLCGTWTDGTSGRLMVGFFARYQDPRIFAGRRVQFLFNGDKELDAIHVQDLPLEQ